MRNPRITPGLRAEPVAHHVGERQSKNVVPGRAAPQLKPMAMHSKPATSLTSVQFQKRPATPSIAPPPCLRSKSNKVLQRAIAAVSAPGTLADLNRAGGDPADDPSRDMGSTSPVINSRAPRYQVHTSPVDGGGVIAKITLAQTAYQGDNVSYYLKAGEHHTGYYWGRGDYMDAAAPHNRLVGAHHSLAHEHVYMVVSSTMANLSRRAEQEHLDDFRRAFQLSLQAAEDAIRAVIRGPETAAGPDADAWYGPYPSPGAANAAMANLVHQQLPPASQALDLDQTRWAADYQTLRDKSQNQRDGNGWHYFGLAESSWWRNNLFLRAVTETWDIYAEHPETQVYYLDVVAGTTQIGNHPTNQIIRF